MTREGGDTETRGTGDKGNGGRHGFLPLPRSPAPPSPPLLTVAVIAHNEERFIEGALRSAQPLHADLLVVLDARTTDRTGELARDLGARVVVEPFRSFSAQRNRALDVCQTPWVLFLDADEQLSEALCAEITALIHKPSLCAGYWIPRRNRYWRRWLRGGGWYPDHQLRLLRRGYAGYDPNRLVHEVAILHGETSFLENHLLHWNIDSFAELRTKQRGYALAEAQALWRSGARARWRNLLLQPPREVKRRFWSWQGYRDGALGLFLALIMGYYEWVKYVHLKALERAL